eukprot:10475836-Alexandrium_andersonii.AAC.1
MSPDGTKKRTNVRGCGLRSSPSSRPSSSPAAMSPSFRPSVVTTTGTRLRTSLSSFATHSGAPASRPVRRA